MSDASRHVVKVLEIILSRSESALRAYEEGNDELALESLKAREIGFANLRAVEWVAENEGGSIGSDPAASKLVAAVLGLDAQLFTMTRQAMDKAALELRRIKRVKQRLGKYHSGSQEGARFEKSV